MPYKDPDAQREYQRQWMAARRKAWFEGKVCVDCGTDKDLQLDHVDASQKVSHRIWSWSAFRREAELAKCVARCNPCHVKKTVANKEKAQGGRNGQAKLTLKTAQEIRQRAASGETKRGLAREYGVDEKAIRLLILQETW